MTIAPERLASAPPRVHRGAERLARSWGNTPGKLRFARLVVVILCLIAGGAGTYSAWARAGVARQIAQHTEPLSADAIEVYRAFADSDAEVALEFRLPSDADKAKARASYDAAIGRAALGLSHAATQASEQGLSTDRIARIVAALPVYYGLVERARAHDNDVAELREASAYMQSTILRQTEALQRDEAGRLDDQYRRARSLPASALVLGGLCLVALAAAQVFLFRKTRRLVNVGLVAATTVILAAAVWWAAAVSVSQPHLRSSQRHSKSVTAALGQAQIAARQARAIELRAVQSSESRSDENTFKTKLQLVARQEGDLPGAGGALGAAAAFTSDQVERRRIDDAVRHTIAWSQAHDQLRAHPDAAAFKDDTEAFNTLDVALSTGLEAEGTAFTRDIGTSQVGMGRPVAVTGLAALLAAAAAAWGIGRRLEEYR